MNLGDLYDDHQLDAAGREAVAGALRFASWCWPEAQSPAFAQAQRLAGAPPQPCPGRVPLLGVAPDHRCAYLLGLCIDAAADETGETVAFDATARRTWREAAALLPRALPMLWSAVRPLADAEPFARILHVEALRDAADSPRVLGGRSYGLSFLLALASRVSGVPVPDDVAASACLERDGRLAPVDGLFEKLTALRQAAPRVRRIVVAAAQDEVGMGDGHFAVVRVGTAAQAVSEVFGDDRLAEEVANAARDPERRRELADSLFRLVLAGGHLTPDWRPVWRAADTLVGNWEGSNDEALWQVQFVRGVARRHVDNRGELPPATPEDLARLPQGVRARVLAHIVQHAHDAGSPPLPGVECLVRKLLPARPAESWPEQLRAWGAWARLLAVTGRPEEALRIQEELTRQFIAELQAQTITYQLAERLRLAGALRKEEAWDCALKDYRWAEARGYIEEGAADFVRLWHGASALHLGRRDEGLAVLRDLVGRPDAKEDLRWSALRHLRWAGEKVEDAKLASAAARHDRVAAAYAALVDLDAALAAGDGDAARQALERLRKADPAVVGHLESAAERARVDAADYVARFYPY